MQRPPEGRERDIYDGWAAQQEYGYRKQFFTCQMNPSRDANGTTTAKTSLANLEFACVALAKSALFGGSCAAAGERRMKSNSQKKINKNNKKDSK